MSGGHPFLFIPKIRLAPQHIEQQVSHQQGNQNIKELCDQEGRNVFFVLFRKDRTEIRFQTNAYEGQ